MKPKNLLLLPALIAALNLLPVGQAPGQTFTTLCSIDPDDGAPIGGLVLSSNTLYGTTSGLDQDTGGYYGVVFAVGTDGTDFRFLTGGGSTARLTLSGNTLYGTSILDDDPLSGDCWVYAINTDGTGFRVLETFTPIITDYGPQINDTGWNPQGVTVVGATVYGATATGGSVGGGTIFKVSTNGTGFTILADGQGGSDGPLSLSGDTLYGTSSTTVFSINTNGTDLIYLFSESLYGTTNADGMFPTPPVLSGSTLYGTATGGGVWGDGTVFAVNTDGTGFRLLHTFTSLSGDPGTNSDGAYPGQLILSGSTLYGMAGGGGSSGAGAVFAINTNGTGFRLLHTFTSLSGDPGTNSDGASPNVLVLNGSTLYGSALDGGSSGAGTLYAINTNGTGFTNLYSFTGAGDGANPWGLIFSGDTLYGETGSTVFSLSFAPQLTITSSGTQVILSWPTNAAGFDYTGYVLESAGNMVSPAAWSTNFPAPVVIAGRNTVTNEITGTEQFYQLIR